jgi:hypothetical protein
MATMPPGNARAKLTSRIGVGRIGATRVGFLPKDTEDADGFYIWTDIKGTDDLETTPRASVWTTVEE